MERTHRLRFRHAFAAGALTVVLPIAAAAQTPPKSPDLPRFDVAGSVIWMGADSEGLTAENWRNWDTAGAVELGAGFYWTEHLKLAIDAGASGDREVFGTVEVRLTPSLSRYVYVTHRIRSRWLTPTVQYQFLHNTWVHPYVGGGFEVDWERRRTDNDNRNSFTGPPGIFNSTDAAGATVDAVGRATRVRAVLLTGAKFYVSPRIFARTDLRVSFTDKVRALRWAAGIGVDF